MYQHYPPFTKVVIIMLVKRFYLKDIKKYEEENNVNLMTFFEDIKLSNVLELIKLGNGWCSDEEAANLLDRYLETHSLRDALIEIKNCLLGKDMVDEESDGVSVSEYDSLTAIYNDICFNLMSLGISYSEFWDMTTRDMYRAYESIQTKATNDLNRELFLYYTLAAMVGQAVWGKLQKQPPQVKNEREEYDPEFGLSSSAVSALLKLKARALQNKISGGENTNG